MSAKKAFYPSEEIETLLEAIPKGQLSSRINDLILKGITLEHRLKVEQDYIRFDESLAQEKPRKKNKDGLSTNMMMSSRAFEAEDEAKDFI